MEQLSFIYWHWWALGSFLLIVELLAPGMFFLWLAFSAFLTGGVLWAYPNMEMEFQWMAFAFFSVTSIFAVRRLLITHPIPTDQPLLNRRVLQLSGRVFCLEDGIVNGEGKMKVDDTVWRIRGQDCPKGTMVRVVSADGVVLNVEKAR